MCHRKLSYRIAFLPKYGTKGVWALASAVTPDKRAVASTMASSPLSSPRRMRVRISVSSRDDGSEHPSLNFGAILLGLERARNAESCHWDAYSRGAVARVVP